ncbi:hypothetical protein CPB84DRAFT_1851776 [Gymnopilus junonius]|uniref:Uncharacterized protein n=1 Tax=Gymnopilus junonius TaxID=109634 RepID=A0A9P5TIX1_GYMJU|nr:hypothetical protein CPB84DRAFT_1851776 [Gymnopilus junonius]
MGKHWAQSGDQLSWLKEQIPGYHEAQKKKNIDRFLTQCQSAWFQTWPMHAECFPGKPETDPLSAEEKTKLSSNAQQIMWWLQWNGNLARHSQRKDATAFVRALGLEKKPKTQVCCPQRVVIYQKLFADKVNAAVNKEIKKLGTKSPGTQMKICCEITQNMLGAEPAKVQEKIDEELWVWKEEREKELQEGEEEEAPE